jgi:hypothetical protein
MACRIFKYYYPDKNLQIWLAGFSNTIFSILRAILANFYQGIMFSNMIFRIKFTLSIEQ